MVSAFSLLSCYEVNHGTRYNFELDVNKHNLSKCSYNF